MEEHNTNKPVKYGGFVETPSIISRVVDCISITRGSQFNFPTAMFTKNGLEKYEAVRLLYDRSEKLVAFEFLKDKLQGSFKLSPSGPGAKYGAYILAKSFFFLNDLRPVDSYAGRYDYVLKGKRELGSDEDGVLFIIDLKKRRGDGT